MMGSPAPASKSGTASADSSAEAPLRIVTKLALKGGGARGYAYLGVAKALDELGYLDTIDTIAGSSAGAISALLLATGLPVDRLTEIMNKANISGMVYAETWYQKCWNFMYYGGIHQGQGFVDWFGDIIEEVTGSKDTTFAQWHAIKEAQPDKNMKDMIIEACNMNREINEVFTHDSDYKDIKIKEAIRASMAFPGFFTPWKIKVRQSNGTHKIFTFQDGGIQANCPIGVFNLPGNKANPEALAIWLAQQAMIDYIEKGTPLPDKTIEHDYQLFEAAVEASLNTQTYAMVQSPYLKDTVLCSALDVGTLQFNLSQKQKGALADTGYLSTMKYFGRYVQPDAKQGVTSPIKDGKAEQPDISVEALGDQLAQLQVAPPAAADAIAQPYSLATSPSSPVTLMYGYKEQNSRDKPVADADKQQRPKPSH